MNFFSNKKVAYMENKLKEALADLDKRIQQAVGQATINNIIKRTSFNLNSYTEITTMQNEIDDAIDELTNKKNELHYVVNALLGQEVRLKTWDKQAYEEEEAIKRGEYGDSDDDFDFLNWGDDEDDKSDNKKDAKKYEGDGDDQEF